MSKDKPKSKAPEAELKEDELEAVSGGDGTSRTVLFPEIVGGRIDSRSGGKLDEATKNAS